MTAVSISWMSLVKFSSSTFVEAFCNITYTIPLVAQPAINNVEETVKRPLLYNDATVNEVTDKATKKATRESSSLLDEAKGLVAGFVMIVITTKLAKLSVLRAQPSLPNKLHAGMSSAKARK